MDLAKKMITKEVPLHARVIKSIPHPKVFIFRCPELNGDSKADGYLQHLSADIKNAFPDNYQYFLDYPVVYIHTWTSFKTATWDSTRRVPTQKIYVGEADDVVRRQGEHWENAQKKDLKIEEAWQKELVNDKDEEGKKVVPTLYIIACNLFTKSMILDIENRLMGFAIATKWNKSAQEKSFEVKNGRYNPQNDYFSKQYTNDIFRTIWEELNNIDNDWFIDINSIMKSTVYKMSPHHELTDEQKEANRWIVTSCSTELRKHTRKNGSLIMVEGEAGTGKSVLACTTFYDLMYQKTSDGNTVSSGYNVKMLVNHTEQLLAYSTIAEQLGLPMKKGNESVLLPTKFINNYNTFANDYPDRKPPVDIVFVDEAHLLWSSNNRGNETIYDPYQIRELMKRAKITVIMFDEYQALKKDQYLERKYIKELRKLAEGNHFALKSQLRMNCSKEQMDWINCITGVDKEYNRTDCKIAKLPDSTETYEIKICKSLDELSKLIREKAEKKEASLKKEKEKGDVSIYGLSRIIATYDWAYTDGHLKNEDSYYYVAADGEKWKAPWNGQIYLSAKEYSMFEPDHFSPFNESVHKLRELMKKKNACSLYEKLSWAEQGHTIDEVGSTYTIQGFDLEYAGVILGPSVRYNAEQNVIWFDPMKKEVNSGKEEMCGYKTLPSGKVIHVGDILLRNELRVLLTRGTKGLYIFACDDELRAALENAVVNEP